MFGSYYGLKEDIKYLLPLQLKYKTVFKLRKKGATENVNKKDSGDFKKRLVDLRTKVSDEMVFFSSLASI